MAGWHGECGIVFRIGRQRLGWNVRGSVWITVQCWDGSSAVVFGFGWEAGMGASGIVFRLGWEAGMGASGFGIWIRVGGWDRSVWGSIWIMMGGWDGRLG